ncbi:DNA-directed RNA polymerases IV and V subunit 4 isoform X1 [Beta vulgaris subsp. vulgaris]|uniref:DNA-directed RNA polymerases IV and V subunit 4 isoform X1 n=1 Tax=Beta vulgaris subsp. vulgaris TaxID=3555 RepID=UPI002036CDAF|nr:DNA-directed RNA polymerases IV and V subunit 4 isoform X1 [Beta vulgaris subsp. vulgaris]
MAEKGGKGFSVGKGVPLKGKDDDSTKSKKGRKVHFNDEEAPANISSKSGGKGETLNGGKGGKSSAGKETTKYELNVQAELPKNSRCVMDCEAADILQGIQEQMVFLSRDPTIKLPVSFDRGLLYAKAGGRYSDPKAVRKVLDRTLKKYGVSDGEICVIANSCPENAEEAFALVPSLKAKRSKINERLEDVLSQLVKLKLSTESLKE